LLVVLVVVRNLVEVGAQVVIEHLPVQVAVALLLNPP
jgi:hypothetical protein